jgi:HEAT repeat protein
MKNLIPWIIAVVCVFSPTRGFTAGDADNLERYMNLLKTGNKTEKKLALHELQGLLKSPQDRKAAAVFEPILNALRDNDPSIREAAAAFLKQLGKHSKQWREQTTVVPDLIKALNDNNPRIRCEAAKALAFFRDNRAISPLIKSLHDRSPWVRLEAASSLGILRSRKAVSPLLELFRDDSDWRNKFVQREALFAIRKIDYREPKLLPWLIKKFDDEYLKVEIIKALGEFHTVEAKNLLFKATKDSNEHIRSLALSVIANLPATATKSAVKEQEPKTDLFITSLKDPSTGVRANAVRALGEIGDDRAIEPLIGALNDTHSNVQMKTLEALGKFKDQKILGEIIPFLGSKDQQLRNVAEKSFIAVAKRTAQARVYVYRKDGVRYIAESRNQVPKGINYSELMIHPDTAEKLIHALNTFDFKTGILKVLVKFEDDRIEPHLINLLEDASPQVRTRAISQLYHHAQKPTVPHLIEALKDKDNGVRKEAARILGYLKDKRAVQPLLESLNDTNVRVREASATALGQLGDKKTINPLIERLNDSNDNVRGAALSSLVNFDDPRIVELTIKMFKDESRHVRRCAVWNIKKKPDKRAVESLILLLSDPDSDIPCLAAQALGDIGDKRAVVPLIKALNDLDQSRPFRGDKHLRDAAAQALGKIGDERAVPHLLRALDDKQIAASAIKALGTFEDPRVIPALSKTVGTQPKLFFVATQALENYGCSEVANNLIKCVSHEDTEIKRGAILLLGKFGNEKTLEPLEKMSKDPDPQIRNDLQRAIKSIKSRLSRKRQSTIPALRSQKSIRYPVPSQKK